MNSSDKQHIVASEAQRLIGVSLAKIAQSRVSRGGVSLHKNLLVATVLQKARYVFMEEAYHIVHGHYPQHSRQFVAAQRHHQQQHQQYQQQLHQQHQHHQQQQQQQLLHHHHQLERAKYANQQQQQIQQQQQLAPHHAHYRESSAKSSLTKQQQQHHQQLHATYRHHYSRLNCDDFEHSSNNAQHESTTSSSTPSPHNNDAASHQYADKENISPPESPISDHPVDQLTYLDLDTHNKLMRPSETVTLKRRRVISESETKEAVLSILPKRSRTDGEDSDSEEDDDDTGAAFLKAIAGESSSQDTATLPAFDEPMDEEEEETATDLSTYSAEPMEIDRISSLVSIFNFGHLSARSPPANLENCSTQANHQHDESQNGSGVNSGSLHHQHSLLAMSV